MRNSRVAAEERFSNFMGWLYRDHDFRIIPGIRNFVERQRSTAINIVNKFQDDDYFRLGPDLHAASYTLKLGGSCRIHGSTRWIKSSESKLLPTTRVNDFRVEGLDLSRTVIQTSGIVNIQNCQNLKTLILSNCFFVDDWTLNRIAHAFSMTLENLDISNCSLVTDNGLLPLAFLRNLKTLNVTNLKVKNKEFISLLIEDELNDLNISGCDHMSNDALKNVEKQLEKEEQNLKEIREKFPI